MMPLLLCFNDNGPMPPEHRHYDDDGGYRQKRRSNIFDIFD